MKKANTLYSSRQAQADYKTADQVNNDSSLTPYEKATEIKLLTRVFTPDESAEMYRLLRTLYNHLDSIKHWNGGDNYTAHLRECAKSLIHRIDTSTETAVKEEIASPITDQRREDMLCGALEGGSNYWYFLGNDADKIVCKYGDHKTTPYVTLMWKAIQAGESIPVRDAEDTSTVLGHINMKSIEEGEALMLKNYKQHYADIISENDDAITADVWFQLAVMKDVVYG